MKTLLDEATKKGYCVPAPSVFNALTIETAFSRAVKVHSPVILNAGGPLDFEFLAETAKFYSRRNPEVPVALNLDHGDDFEQAMRAIRAGFTSVMLDKSSAPFEENIRETKEVVHAAHIVGVSVEAELGCVGFGRLSDDENTDSFTKPEDVDIFIRETGADCLAIAIGTAHGHYKGTPKIDFERLDAIRAVTSVPLVLHGGSSTGEENLKKMAQGIEGIYESTVADWGTMFVGNANRLDELFARRYSYQHNLSVAGSTDKSDYRISLAYADNQANLATAYDGQKQLNLRLNYGIKLTDWFKLETSASMIKTNTETPTHGIDRTLYGNDAPFFPAKNPYGQWYANFGNVGDRNAAAATTDGGRDEREKLTTRVDFKALVDIWKGITFEGTASFQNEEYRRERYSLPVQCYNWFGEQTAKLVYETTQTLSTPQDVMNFKDSHQPGYLVQANNARYQYYSGLLKYKRTFAEVHNIDAMFGISAEKWVNKKVVTAREKFEDAGIYDLNLATGTQGNGGGKTHNGTYSYIARLNYNYAEKYMVELMGRRDGNSKFAPGYRFKSFGSVSLGWAFSEEQFVEFLKPVLSFGKLRLSYGSSGNDVGLGDYDYVSTVSLGTAGFGTIPANQVSSGFGGLISYDRTWEKVSQKNFGIDLNFFDNRLKATFDYFIKDNTGMLVNVTYPGVLGGKAPKTNSGHLNVKGWEFTIGWRDQIKDFSYYANFNIGDTKSLLKEMEGADSYGAGWNAAVNGYPLNSYFLYRTDGYFKDQAEVDRYYALYGEGKEDLTGVGAGSASRLRPGDTKRLDLNGDYKISGAGNENSDLQYLGDSNPHFVFGFTLGGSWKGIDVNAMFQGVGKQYVIRNDWMAYPFQTRTANQNPTYLGKTWTESNPNAEFPRLTTNANLARWNYQNNDFMMQNNRYIRLKTLIVGYTLPQIWTRKVKLEKVRVYFSGNDLWEATSIRDGFDPEMGAASNNSGYPFARTWSFGLNITL